MNKLKYLGYAIVFQEVPNETTLTINISGCPYKCKGCHSKYLWEYKGNYISDDMDNLLNKYDGLITCVCFMGGDQNIDELTHLMAHIRDKNLKICIYTGCEEKSVIEHLMTLCDYIKYGRYVENLTTDNNIQHGVKLATSNQKFIMKGIDY